MAVRILIPSPFRSYVGNADFIELEGKTVGELLTTLTQHHPELKPHLFAANGKVRPFVSVFLNQDEIRGLQGLDTPVTPKDVIQLAPAVAGG